MKIFRFVFLWMFLALLLIGCKTTAPGQIATPSPNPTVMKTRTPTELPAAMPDATSTQMPPDQPTQTLALPSDTPSIPTVTLVPELTVPEPPKNDSGLIIDHQSVQLFDQIPDEYLQAASQITWLHRHASVGVNIRFGLDCMMNFFPDRADPNRRPSACDRDMDPGDVVYGAQYDSGNWIFEVHAQTNPNPGWYNKTTNFIERINNLTPGETYDYASFNFGYVEDPTLIEYFFSDTSAANNFPTIKDLENLQAQHPEITFIWWTSPLARQTPEHILEFNQQLREVARANGWILFDIADIESFRPHGTSCTGVDANANLNNVTAVCADYANETFAGHLNAQGSSRAAKAVWVMMAILAGWDGTSQ